MISFLIINYNTPNHTFKAVSSIKKYLKIPYEIIIVDNGSNISLKKQKFDSIECDIKIIKLNENKGFGVANNLAYINSKGDYICLLNSDAYLIDKNTIKYMVDYLSKYNDVAMVGPNFIKENGAQNYAYGNFLSVKKILIDIGILKIKPEIYKRDLSTYLFCDFNKPTIVDYIGAAGVIIKKSVIEEIGLFDPSYFLYFEDMDFGYRIKKAGYKSVILPNATIVHLGGASTNKSRSSELNKKINNSKYIFLRKRYSIFLVVLLKGISLIKKIFYKLILTNVSKSKR
ncbi:glycosyltransferase family 2 protein [Croceibacter atlanticus]|uniref:glycosyltransferase family 2 protein n=1 Tax=Croceibacter atlanticus TaxID=313588 RepID=UPI0024B93862|nr:glycosyltransferase family 2 protein [Croceibacter atlanticus]WSP33514.1 glycosyltransferase family 2 protein [Croceibacter atlanticus]